MIRKSGCRFSGRSCSPKIDNVTTRNKADALRSGCCLSTTSFSSGSNRAADSCRSFSGTSNLLRTSPKIFSERSQWALLISAPACVVFHVAAGIDTRSARRFTNQVDQPLPETELAVGGEADEDPLFLVVREPRDELVGDGRNGVLAAQALIERFVFGPGRTGQQCQCKASDNNDSASRSHSASLCSFKRSYGKMGAKFQSLSELKPAVGIPRACRLENRRFFPSR